MIRLPGKLCLLALPVMLLTLGLASLALHTGEIMPAAQIAELQRITPGLIYGQSRACKFMEYKLASYRSRRPQVVILGDSLALSIRPAFFTRDPTTVYNASVYGWGLEQLLAFNAQIKELPRVVILSLNVNWFFGTGETEVKAWQGCQADDYLQSLVETARKLLSGDLTLQRMLSRRNLVYGSPSIGLSAIELGAGFREDGSFVYGRRTLNLDTQAQMRKRAVKNASARIALGSTDSVPAFNEPAFQMLEDALANWRQAGVETVGVTMPSHFQLLDQQSERDSYGYRAVLLERIGPLFAQYGYPYNYIDDIRPYGAQYSDWIDANHLTESGSLRLILALFHQHPELFADYIDISKVENLVENYTNPMDVLRELSP